MNRPRWFLSLKVFYLRIETVGRVDDVINHGGLLLVERLHGSAAAVVLNPLQDQTHDVDAERQEKMMKTTVYCMLHVS